MTQQLNSAQKSSTQIGGQELSLSTGELATQAGGSVLVQFGDTVVLGTATMGRPFQPDGDFMPLLVEYEEKFYAAGKIKGSRFVKREGRPTDDAILTARVIDRSIRPLFPDNMINDIQVVCTVLSYDGENDPDIPAIIASSAALSLSDVPWPAPRSPQGEVGSGPLAAVRVGLIDDKFVINPTHEERQNSKLDLIVAGTADQIVMIEAGANEVDESVMLDALEQAQKALAAIVPTIAELVEKSGKAKQEPTLAKRDAELMTKLKETAHPLLKAKLEVAKSKDEIGNAEREVAQAIHAGLSDTEKESVTERLVYNAVHETHADIFRERVLQESARSDGRGLEQIRPLTVKIDLLPRTHGSGLFQRGQTQILTTCTLGGPGDVQWLDTMEIEAKKRYIHYYNFPAYSVGEIKPMRGPGRREIGHGALAERALLPVLPPQDKWPYTMLLVSEVLESHGSSSMASVCGSTLAMMAAGVPLTKPVAGIAMGLVSDGVENFKILTDIAGIEDEKGDMDFKVAGTRDGVTALQMDIKIGGLTREILSQALGQAKKARLEILEAMAAVISEPRAELSAYAPRIETIQVPVEKIGDLIGPKGKHINEIIEQTGVEIDIDDNGIVAITSNDGEAMKKAMDWVKNMTREIKAGERFEGKVTRLMDFGAFVELVPGMEGLVHISQFREERVENIHDIVKVGDIIPVIVLEIDQMGRINLSHKAAMGGSIEPNEGNRRPERRGGGGGRGNGRPSNRGGFRGPRPPR